MSAQLQHINQHVNAPANVTSVPLDSGVVLTLQYHLEQVIYPSHVGYSAGLLRLSLVLNGVTPVLCQARTHPSSQRRGAFLIFPQIPFSFLLIM